MTTEEVNSGSTTNDLRVQFNEANTTFVQVSSINVQTDGKGLQLDRANNNWGDRADIDKAVADLNIANSVIRTAASSIATNLQIVQTRQDFTSNFSNVLTDGANKLTQSDQNADGAELLTLQTRQQLGTISLSLANQSQQAILRLF
jgi:flagellin-like hook-associated protein FlgL